MKTVRKTLGKIALAGVIVISISCKDGKKNNVAEVAKTTKTATTVNSSQDAKSEVVLRDYFNLKDALVGDDNAKAKQLGGTLALSLKAFDASGYSSSEQNELKDILEDAIEHAEHISESNIKHQREHFKILSKDVTDMVAITGTKVKLYEQFCPMYDGGTAWLSAEKQVLNPYYGSSMLKCGKVQREIK
jgi:hypothetical protein